MKNWSAGETAFVVFFFKRAAGAAVSQILWKGLEFAKKRNMIDLLFTGASNPV